MVVIVVRRGQQAIVLQAKQVEPYIAVTKEKRIRLYLCLANSVQYLLCFLSFFFCFILHFSLLFVYQNFV